MKIYLLLMAVLMLGLVSALTPLQESIKADYISQGYSNEESESIADGSFSKELQEEIIAEPVTVVTNESTTELNQMSESDIWLVFFLFVGVIGGAVAVAFTFWGMSG